MQSIDQPRPWVRRVAAATLGLTTSLLVMVRLAPTGWGMDHLVALVVLLTALLSAFWWQPVVDWLIAAWRQVPLRHARRVLAGCLCGSLLLGFALPLSPAPFRHVSATLEPLDEKAEEAASSEIWVRVEVDGQLAPLDTFQPTDGWVQRDGYWVWSPPAARSALSWEGYAARSVELVLLRRESSGRVRVKAGPRVEVVELFSTAWGEERVELMPDQRPAAFLPRFYRPPGQFFFDLLGSALLGLGLFALVARFTFPRFSWPSRVTSFGFDVWFYALPMLWLGVWLSAVFHPAVMTVDSLVQWGQASNGQLNDSHPITHTLLIAGLRRLWDSPASVAVVQMVALAFAISSLVTVLKRALGAPSWAAALAACAVHPMVAVTSITLWKDTLYTTAVLALVAWGAARVLLSPEKRPSAWAAVGVGVIAFFAMMLRHNGPPTALATFALVAIAAPAARRSVAIAAAVALGLVVIFKGPVTSALNVPPTKMTHFFYAHRIASHLSASQAPAAENDRALLREIEPAADWHYICSVVNSTVYAKSFKLNLAAEHTEDLARIWRELAWRHPQEELEHSMCASSLVWRMDGSDAAPLYLYATGLAVRNNRVSWVEPNSGELPEQSLFPNAAESIGRAMLGSNAWWFWRPAVWLYVFTLAVIIGALRTRNRRVLTLLLVPWIHSAALAAVNIAQDARYQLLVYVLGLVPIVLLLSARRAESSPVAPEANAPATAQKE